MNKQADIFDLFRSKKNRVQNIIKTEIDPYIEELKSIVSELSRNRRNPKLNELFFSMKEIFYSVNQLKQLILNTKLAQSNLTNEYYVDKLSNVLLALDSNLGKLNDYIDNDSILGQLFGIKQKIRNSIQSLKETSAPSASSEAPLEAPLEKENTSNSSGKIEVQNLPNFFQGFVKKLQGYENQEAMIDIEAIRGVLSSWIKKYGLSLFDAELEEYKNRYIPVSSFLKLINNEEVTPTDKNSRTIEPNL